jgi:dihydrofolate reductase
MRKLWVKAWMTLDGVFDADTMDHWWPPAEEAAADTARRLEYIVEEYSKGDVYLLGRTTYEMLWPGWSTQTTGDGPGPILNRMKKYVVSTTLETAPWRESTIIRGNVVEEITKLKQQPGKDIIIDGSTGSWSCPTSWEGEGDSSLRGRKRRSYGLSKARGLVSRPWLSSTNRIKANYLVPKGSYAVSVWGWVKPVVRDDATSEAGHPPLRLEARFAMYGCSVAWQKPRKVPGLSLWPERPDGEVRMRCYTRGFSPGGRSACSRGTSLDPALRRQGGYARRP